MTPVLGEIVGWELLLVVALVALLFGSSQIPKFARSIGEASREFRKGVSDDATDDEPSGEKAGDEKSAGEKPSDEKPAGEKPAGEKPAGEKPSGDAAS